MRGKPGTLNPGVLPPGPIPTSAFILPYRLTGPPPQPTHKVYPGQHLAVNEFRVKTRSIGPRPAEGGRQTASAAIRIDQRPATQTPASADP
jgi:hypothetical protein